MGPWGSLSYKKKGGGIQRKPGQGLRKPGERACSGDLPGHLGLWWQMDTREVTCRSTERKLQTIGPQKGSYRPRFPQSFSLGWQGKQSDCRIRTVLVRINQLKDGKWSISKWSLLTGRSPIQFYWQWCWEMSYLIYTDVRKGNKAWGKDCWWH